MTRDEAVALIAGRLGGRTGIDAMIVNELKAAQTMLEGATVLPWFLIVGAIISVIASPLSGRWNISIPFPADFLREVDGVLLEFEDPDVPDKFVPIPKVTFDDQTWLGLEGKSEAYAVFGEYIYPRPAPDAGFRYWFQYHARAASLSTNIENVWLEHIPLLLVGKAGFAIASSLGNAAAAGLFAGDVTKAETDLRNINTAREEASLNRYMGETP